MNGPQGMNGINMNSVEPGVGRSAPSTVRMARSSELELLHKKIHGVGLHCRQQQMELHELRCSVREYKAVIDNMQDEIRMIRQLLDKKWIGASPRVGDRPRGAGGVIRGEDSPLLMESSKSQSGSAMSGKRGSRGSTGDTNITHEDIVELACTVLRRYPGGMAIAKLGTLMHKEANNHALPSILKERYGGLKKFLQGQQDKCVMGNDHPYNPHVTLRRNSTTNYLQPSPATSIHSPRASPSPLPGQSGHQLTIGNSGAGAIGDLYLDSPSSFGQRGMRRRRSKKTRGHSPQDTLSPNSRHDVVLRGGHSSSPAARLLANTTPMTKSMRANASVGVPNHPRHSSKGNVMRSAAGWSGVVSAPGTPLAATWTDREPTNENGQILHRNASMTPDGGSRSSSLFTSSLSSRLRTNVLKSAYTIRLPAYTGGSKMTRQVALSCGMVEVEVKGGERDVRIGRVVIVNLYGHVLFDEIVRPAGDVIDFKTKESGVSVSDMKRALSTAACRSHLQKMLSGRVIVALNIENQLRELQLTIPARSIRDIAHRMTGPQARSLPELTEKYLGLSVSVRNPIEDGRALMALYWHVHEEWERSMVSENISAPRLSEGVSSLNFGPNGTKWRLTPPDSTLHEEVKYDLNDDEAASQIKTKREFGDNTDDSSQPNEKTNGSTNLTQQRHPVGQV
mmetsp:Transcript_28677/g.39971  ORF Transcript_28677/g.39971 Transcript_28677/m.39971 type:complete len:678 (-) Transcript_28677:1567-3600(-)|eukprot:CAMPEP_0184487474 /NCGR_PEP_ID=MMETSP0113_2-20130426/10133_1 /TAXON_ID=91329 /ORGANISM="Norrisiella sphaerica, Strain BC52" /LENGTH=677 /DNA_ID=CAMNT_0026869805 /DNA_START=115 /DNA_END=2148 /DNA_ORIENTATION=-